MTDTQFISDNLDTASLNNGQFTSTAPSNIALVKYWGKKDNQIPANPSISFTLNNCLTKTKLIFEKRENKNSPIEFSIYFEGQLKPDFKPKIQTFISRILKYVPFLAEYNFEIHTENTFPHSSGIASSASGMAALALCFMQIEKALNPKIATAYFNRKASFLARLGSGSACRSLEGPIVVWGKNKVVKDSSDLFGFKLQQSVHANFENYNDSILLVDSGEKQVSSTLGHNLMHNHPFATNRFEQAHNNLNKLCKVLETGNLKAFISIVESEALTLHAMMLTSNPYFILMKPNTLEIINKIGAFRKKSNLNLCFTLDAGANVHLLYPQSETTVVRAFISKELAGLCQNKKLIHDSLGLGACVI